MELNEEVAEVLGMFAADGCLQEKYLCMWGNIFEDKEYYDTIVCPLFSKVFKRKVIAHEKKSNGVYGFYLCNINSVNYMKDIGFTRNKTLNVSVPKIILNSRDLNIFAAFIRGFSDCDGCLSFMKRKGKYSEFKKQFPTYPRITMGVISFDIIRDISLMLKKLEINHTTHEYKSNREGEHRVYTISVRGIKAVETWIKKIGFHNTSKTSRYELWKQFGMCPAQTNFEQRKKMLSGELNPFSFTNP
ncbi:MAG: LAGLIDADG family homing endonuclease [Nanoarchaeota archaeon]